jgi:hypothetical protein
LIRFSPGELPVVIVNPAQIRAFAMAIGRRAKTDPIDAAVIAHFAEATKPQVRPLPDEASRLLADLVARRRQIIEMIGAPWPDEPWRNTAPYHGTSHFSIDGSTTGRGFPSESTAT